MGFEELHAEVSAKTQGASHLLVDLRPLLAAQESLTDSLLKDAEAKIRAAVVAGFREAELLSFAGGETRDGYSLLSMIAGPRDRGQKAHYKQLGVEPVVDVLRRLMFPFCVYHFWCPFSNLNSVRACW